MILGAGKKPMMFLTVPHYEMGVTMPWALCRRGGKANLIKERGNVSGRPGQSFFFVLVAGVGGGALLQDRVSLRSSGCPVLLSL